MGTGHTVAKLADASELPGVTVAQVNYSTVTDGEVTTFFPPKRNIHVILIDLQSIKVLINAWGLIETWHLLLLPCRWSRTGLSKAARWQSKPLRPRRPHRLSPPWPKPPSQRARRFSLVPQSQWLWTGKEVPAQLQSEIVLAGLKPLV